MLAPRYRYIASAAACLAFVLGSTTAATAATPFAVNPPNVQLEGNFSRAQLVVTAVNAQGKSDERSADLSRKAKFTSDNAKVVAVSETGRLLAVADGETAITVTVDGTTKKVPVKVSGVVAQPTINYTENIVPILTKAGCMAAACHASQHGKGGFKLSVFGFAPDEDYRAIVRDRHGRRANLIDPEQSLVLLKPTMAVPHGGNRRIDKDSVDYQIFKAWLACGAPPPKNDDPKVTAVKVFPAERIGKEGLEQQLRVEATYSNGKTRDVTAWAKYDSMDDGVVAVTPEGYIKALGEGQGPVMVRFEGQAEISMVVIPYATKVQLAGWKNNNFVDEHASAKFRELGIEPSPLADDATFLRRAFLDAVGTLPTVEEATAFLESKDPEKRRKLIDRLLGLTGDPAQDIYNNQYAAYWSIKWADLIRSSTDTVGEQGMWAMHNWIKESFRVNKPFDQFVRELVTAQGSAFRSGAANYFRINKNPDELAETTAQLFLGVRMQCAKCHHHPFEKYSQQDYYGLSAFFARVGSKASQEFGLFGGEQVVLVKSAGDVRNPRTGQIVPPTSLDGEPAPEMPDRRVALADWLTSSKNDYFAKNVVNRYVAYLLGRGLVEPIDDMRATNPPSNPPLMDALAKDFVASKFNIKQLMRTIMNSRLYQLDSQPTATNASDDKFFSHYQVKRIAAEPLLDAIDYLTGVQTKFKNLPQGTRAIELPDSNYPDYFLVTFGKPKRVSVCECERVGTENLAQALHTLNGETLATKIASAGGRLGKLLAAKKPHAEIVNELYLAALSRRPSAEEIKACDKLLAESPNPKVFYEDLIWSLANSKQFLFIR